MTITIFLADDHAVVRDGLRLLLETQPNLKVVGAAADGRETICLVEQLMPDVAIVDIAMPEISGLEAARQLHRTCPRTRIIMLSMYRTPEHIVQALEAGASGYVLKESASDEVIEAVRAVRANGRYLSRSVADAALDYYVRQRQSGAGLSLLDRLNEREREIVRLLADGRTTAEIADRLALSSKSVDTYRSQIMHKLDIHHLPGLVKFAIQHGLASLE
jgi:DNA-binding NarL/FixJ family response regulator